MLGSSRSVAPGRGAPVTGPRSVSLLLRFGHSLPAPQGRFAGLCWLSSLKEGAGWGPHVFPGQRVLVKALLCPCFQTTQVLHSC